MVIMFCFLNKLLVYCARYYLRLGTDFLCIGIFILFSVIALYVSLWIHIPKQLVNTTSSTMHCIENVELQPKAKWMLVFLAYLPVRFSSAALLR